MSVRGWVPCVASFARRALRSFWKDNAAQFTRPWFAWANSFFGMTLDNVAERFPGLL